MARRPEVTFSYNFDRIKKQLNVYERSQAKFAGKKALTRLNRELKGKNGLVAKTYKRGTLTGGRFRDPVTFTLASTYGIQAGLDLTVGVKDEKAMGDKKGNPASKYLYPTIGGGSTKAYDTTFTQYLRNKNFIKNAEYPYAFFNSRYIKKTKRNRVSKSTYRNTVIALEQQKDHGSIGGKLQDARVIAFKNAPKGRKTGGIYREVPLRTKTKTGSKKFKLEPLFLFKKTPRQAGKVTFSQRIKKIADKRVFKYWVKATKDLAKESR